ncbi:MAG: hypothetical protein LUH02_12180 [Erysipelotrichaceae bacterium]|nr:hypothetical protein [Erysipelotrichaceae bacterium]
MSNKVFISAEDYEYLKASKHISAEAVRNSYGRVIGYRVWDFYLNDIERKKLARSQALNAKINTIKNAMNDMEQQYQQANDNLNKSINETLKQAEKKLAQDTKLDLKEISTTFNKAHQEVIGQIKQTRNNILSNNRQQISITINALQQDMLTSQKNALQEINDLKYDISLQKSKENQYALAYLNNAKEALEVLKSTYDERYNNINIITNIENDIIKCENNIKNSLYQAVIANSIDIQSKCYEELLNFDNQRQEYNALYQEAQYHINWLLDYSKERMRVSNEVLETANEFNPKHISKIITKRDLKDFSPENAIDLQINILNNYKEQLDNHAYSLSQIKDELETIRCLYQSVDDVFNDAISYYVNYLERESFMNSIIDTFEDHGRVYQSFRLGEENNKNDMTQPLFVLFADESTGSEFMVEISCVGTPQTKLESEFHIHKIQGDPNNQHENKQTELLVNEAVNENNEDAIIGGSGCQMNAMNKLSEDERILKIRRLM